MKILVQIPYDWDHIKEVPQLIIEKVKSDHITVFTPSIFAEAYLYQGTHDFTARMLSIALTIDKDKELIPWSNRPVKIYIGPAPRSIEFDEIIVYKQHTLSTQEEYLKTALYDSDFHDVFQNKIYSSSDGTMFFEQLDRLAEYLILASAQNES